MNTGTIRNMDRTELIEWLEANTIAVEANGIDVDDRTDDDLRDEVCAVLASQYSDEDPPSRV